MTILDRLDSREDMIEPDDVAEVDEAIRADRLDAHGLPRILSAYDPGA